MRRPPVMGKSLPISAPSSLAGNGSQNKETPCLPCFRGENVVLRPECPVQRPVLDRFGDVPGLDDLAADQIGDRTRYLEDTVVRPRTEALLHHGALQQMLRVRAQLAIFANLPRAHLGVGIDSLPLRLEAL